MSGTSISPIRVAIAVVGIGVIAVLALVATDYGSAADEPPEDARQVLFIGNSHTFYNDLPAMVERLANEDDDTEGIAVDEVTAGGASLGDHVGNPELERFVTDGAFDVVVIQANSVEPLIDRQATIEDFRTLAAWSEEGGAQPVLYELWPREQGSAIYEQPWAPDTQEEYARRVQATSEDAVDQTGAHLAPVGRTWERSRRRATEIELYQEDGNHPTEAGTYLAALVIYATIEDGLPDRELWGPPGIGEADANTLQELAGRGG